MAVNLGLLGVFKYFGFFVDQFATLAASIGLPAHIPTIQIILPVGISFFTFQAMSYVLDVWRGKLEQEQSLLRFATYIALFPQLVAGPIVRASRLLPQLTLHHKFNWPNFWIGAEQIMWGLAMKVIIADRLGPLVDRRFAVPEVYNGLELALAVVFFAIQIYCDFAGYSLIAIGLGRIMGLSFPINFRRPYLARSFSDFWERWHISLSSWLRDYLYIALGGNRGGVVKTYRNLMTTMLLGGLWHGAGWPFIIWGALHGSYLIIQRLVQPFMPDISGKRVIGYLGLWATRLMVFSCVCIAWVFFRAETLEGAMDMLRGIFAADSYAPGQLKNKFQLMVVIALIIPMMALEIAYEDSRRVRMLAKNRAVRGGFAVILMCMIPLFGTFGGSAFVYFQF